jgi:hypothetical protein
MLSHFLVTDLISASKRLQTTNKITHNERETLAGVVYSRQLILHRWHI